MTIPLNKPQIDQINNLLEKGAVIELRFLEGDLVDAEGGKQVPRPPQILISKRAELETQLDVPPFLIDQDNSTQLGILGYPASGGVPVTLANFMVPAGFYFSGIKGYISQEMDEELEDDKEGSETTE